MRDQLKTYVSLLFAGVRDAGEIQEEILQNTLDRYDDLISQGKNPEAAYRLAITGIGDLSEIFSGIGNSEPKPLADSAVYQDQSASREDPPWKRLGRAVAIGLYILSPLPLFSLTEIGMNTSGLCGLLSFVAVATVLLLFCKKEKSVHEHSAHQKPESELTKSLNTLIGAIALCIYLILSFATLAWHVTWLVFPIAGAVKGMIKAILDLKEEK